MAVASAFTLLAVFYLFLYYASHIFQHSSPSPLSEQSSLDEYQVAPTDDLLEEGGLEADNLDVEISGGLQDYATDPHALLRPHVMKKKWAFWMAMTMVPSLLLGVYQF